jgi:hypothetical protein
MLHIANAQKAAIDYLTASGATAITSAPGTAAWGFRWSRGRRRRGSLDHHAGREFRNHQGIEWRWFMIMLFAFAIINYLAGRG